ncbi:WD40 repeat-like protein [Parathielavia hyrcaniae]|uniref:WD40 repeat-like protein n=1 Tax=Parathielavia hyrcaniae TaxID=113614 RepID=A0AAN6Q5G9_9PEZI|nr:WD40 repeat-like protein [Parathielavia hyrcaniae]
MSSTITATTPPTSLSKLRDVAVVLSPSDRAFLTSSFSQGSRPLARPPARSISSEPPAKRIRREENTTPTDPLLDRCLKTQVFPHIDLRLRTLSQDRSKTLGIGRQVVALLVGDEFAREYNSRADGTISRDFELKLAYQAARFVQYIADGLNPQLIPPITSEPLSAPWSFLETPIPLPENAHLFVPARNSSTPSSGFRYSTSPIPLPVIPDRPPATQKNVRPNGTVSVPQRSSLPASVTRPPPEVITIDDDDEDLPELLVADKKPVTPEKPMVTQGHHKGSFSKSDMPIPAPPIPTPPAVPRTLPVRSSPATSPSLVLRSPNAPSASVAARSPVRHPAPAVAAPPAAPTSTATLSPVGERATTTRPSTTVSLSSQRTSQDARADLVSVRSKWFYKQRLPYLTAAQRASVVYGTQQPLELGSSELLTPLTFHVDFSAEEIKYLRDFTRLNLPLAPKAGNPRRDLTKVLKKNQGHVRRILDLFALRGQLPGRTRGDVENSFKDLINQEARIPRAVLTLERDSHDQRGDHIRSSRVHSLLFAREIFGQRGVGSRCPQQLNFQNEFRKYREDDLEKKAEWTGCAGDIFTVSWVSNDSFICGTTEHSDSHNQQYNKPGNLVLGSCSSVTLRAYPEHRIVRPIVEKGENSTGAMRESQDPWLYSSVVSSDYDAIHDRAFTCSFDRTVKIWKVEKSGSSMGLLGEWRHGGNVNFVAASKHELGMVATAADVAVDAVRIYNVAGEDIARSPFQSYSCSRVTDERGNTVSTEKWAYFPATMQWGLADGVKNMLLVGYSPRSRTGDDNDIPVERRDTGELCLWDGITGERWRVTSATTQNVFEVLWHPAQACFIAATSPSGLDLESSVRTQIRIFRPADQLQFGVKAYSPIMTLDCTAFDINELTIMPNSLKASYVTAGCTDGNTYVWDTARGDKPIHVLRHGEPIDEYRGDREREDVGVKFTAWGTTPDRFYTGSSDGLVRVWNIRSLDKPLIRNLLEAPAPITAGMLCPDKSRLVVGDASGRVFMLSINDEKEQPMSVTEVPLPGGGSRKIQRPPAIIPHPDPPAPSHDAEGRPIIAISGPVLGRAYLESLQLERYPNPTIGVVHGPRYAETGLFRRELHLNEDPNQPLLAQCQMMQQEDQKPQGRVVGKRRDQGLALKPLKEVAWLQAAHRENSSGDQFGLDVGALSEETRLELERGGVDFELVTDYLLEEEE